MPLGMHAACDTRHVRGMVYVACVNVAVMLHLRGMLHVVRRLQRDMPHGGEQRVEHPRTVTPALPIEYSAHPSTYSELEYVEGRA